MPKIVVLGSCRYEPYKVLIMPNKLDPELYARDQDLAYAEVCKKFYPAIDEADFIIVWNPDSKVGEHTQKDIAYARSKAKTVVFVFPDAEEQKNRAINAGLAEAFKVQRGCDNCDKIADLEEKIEVKNREIEVLKAMISPKEEIKITKFS